MSSSEVEGSRLSLGLDSSWKDSSRLRIPSRISLIFLVLCCSIVEPKSNFLETSLVKAAMKPRSFEREPSYLLVMRSSRKCEMPQKLWKSQPEKQKTATRRL